MNWKRATGLMMLCVIPLLVSACASKPEPVDWKIACKAFPELQWRDGDTEATMQGIIDHKIRREERCP